MSFPDMPDPNAGDDQQEAPPADLSTEEQSDQPPVVNEEQASPASSEAQLPPEAQGETNGGPLGCCLGITVGLLFSIFIGVIGFGHNLAFLLGFVVSLGGLTDIRIAAGFIAFLV